jgi:hypothetical protein
VGFQRTEFSGVFDGNGHAISHLTISGESWLGLFGLLTTAARISNMRLKEVDVNGTGEFVGGLVGRNRSRTDHWGRRRPGAVLSNCSSTGTVSGDRCVGGLAGLNEGTITTSHSTGVVTGYRFIGGLVGVNRNGSVTTSYSTANVTGNEVVGGLVGTNQGSITMSYSIADVSGNWWVGGLVGNGVRGCVTDCFWNIETSGQTSSVGGTSKTTAEMQIASTFLEASWDLVNETTNGTEDIWWILEGQDYPRLWWEKTQN